MTAVEIADMIKDISLGVTPILTILINNIYNSKNSSISNEHKHRVIEKEHLFKSTLLKEEDRKTRRQYVYNELVRIYDSISEIEVEYCISMNIDNRDEINEEYKRISEFSDKAKKFIKNTKDILKEMKNYMRCTLSTTVC